MPRRPRSCTVVSKPGFWMVSRRSVSINDLHLHNWLAYLSEMIEFRIDRSVNRIETNGVARAQHKRVIEPGVKQPGRRLPEKPPAAGSWHRVDTCLCAADGDAPGRNPHAWSSAPGDVELSSQPEEIGPSR